MNKQKNEGEGSKSADKAYRAGASEFAKSGKVKEAAEQARQAVDSGEDSDLRKAVEEGKRHSVGEDPLLYKKGTKTPVP